MPAAPYNETNNDAKPAPVPEIWAQSEVTIDGTESLPQVPELSLRKIIVKGKLSCHPAQSIVINLDQLVIDGGVFECGRSIVDSFNGTIQFNFKSSKDNSAVHIKNDGKLILHGRTHAAWSRLQETALVGSNRIKMPKSIDWEAGEEIVIAPSDFIFDAYETLSIKDIEPAGICMAHPECIARPPTLRKDPKFQWSNT